MKVSHSLNVLPSAGTVVRLAAVFGAVFSTVALSSPGRIDIVDGQTRYEVARSLVDHGDDLIRDKDCWFAVYEGRNGNTYTNYRLPQSLLGVVAILIADGSESRRQFFFSLIPAVTAALLAVVYTLYFTRQGYRNACLWGLAGIFCTPSWYYGTSSFDDILGALGVVLAVTCNSGLTLAWAVNCKPTLIFFCLPVLVHKPWQGIAGTVFGTFLYLAYDKYKFPDTQPLAEYVRLYGPIWNATPFPGLIAYACSVGCSALLYHPTLLLCYFGSKRHPDTFYVLLACGLYATTMAWLCFYKGDPCWGPRYLTPVFAVLWLYAPLATMRGRGLLLALGVIVQVMALSVDTERLMISRGLQFCCSTEQPFMTFNPTMSHILQRPHEIVEVLTSERAEKFNPGPIPTHVGRLTETDPSLALRRYHIFCSLRPWIVSYWYLEPANRPIDILRTALLLFCLGFCPAVAYIVLCQYQAAKRIQRS